MRYYDTSVLMSLLVPDPHTPRAMAELETDHGSICSGEWATMEIKSALAKEVRMGSLTGRQALAAWEMYELWRLPSGGLLLHFPDRGVLSSAAQAIRIAPDGAANLRAGDAFHVAIAAEVEASGFVTADGNQAGAAEKLDLDVTLLRPAG